MKVIIAYPPLGGDKGYPTLGQNRQFQYFSEPTCIYPVVPAQAATLLKEAGHQVLWLDCNAEGLSSDRFWEIVGEEAPDVIAFETKTPVIKELWAIADKIAAADRRPATADRRLPTGNRRPATVFFGDHVTALPEESFANSRVDYVLTGGDYDFLLANLCSALETGQGGGGPVLRREKLEGGIYYREGFSVNNSGPFVLKHDLSFLPDIDRELTKWRLYSRRNGNFKRTPGTYIMSGRDCWWGKCSFCSWPTLYPHFRVRPAGSVLNEIGALIGRYGVREIMDDTGCFPAGSPAARQWLREFCEGAVKRGYHRRAYFDCNMRFGALESADFKKMKAANFRLLLFGMESANQETLDRIGKGVKVERMIEDCKNAVEAGLYPHLTLMFGYPWETRADALKTMELGAWLLRKGYAYTMQATIVIPYPGTPLFEECRENGWLLSEEWDDYDMSRPVMKSPMLSDDLTGLVREMYRIAFSPEFIMRKLASVRDTDDVRYFLRASGRVLAHMRDFRRPARVYSDGNVRSH